MFSGAIVRQAAHTNNHLAVPRQKVLRLVVASWKRGALIGNAARKKVKGTLTAGNVDEVLASGLVHFNVALANVVLVPLERHVAMLGRHEAHESLAVPPALGAQTQRHSAPVGWRHDVGNERVRHCEIVGRQHGVAH